MTDKFESEKIIPIIATAKPLQEHDEATRTRIYEKIADQNSFSDLLGEKFSRGDNYIRSWLSKIDDKGLKAQPSVEKIRMVNTLLDGNFSDADFDAFIRIFKNSTSTEKLTLRKIGASKGSTRVKVWLALEN